MNSLFDLFDLKPKLQANIVSILPQIKGVIKIDSEYYFDLFNKDIGVDTPPKNNVRDYSHSKSIKLTSIKSTFLYLFFLILAAFFNQGIAQNLFEFNPVISIPLSYSPILSLILAVVLIFLIDLLISNAFAMHLCKQDAKKFLNSYDFLYGLDDNKNRDLRGSKRFVKGPNIKLQRFMQEGRNKAYKESLGRYFQNRYQFIFYLFIIILLFYFLGEGLQQWTREADSLNPVSKLSGFSIKVTGAFSLNIVSGLVKGYFKTYPKRRYDIKQQTDIRRLEISRDYNLKGKVDAINSITQELVSTMNEDNLLSMSRSEAQAKYNFLTINNDIKHFNSYYEEQRRLISQQNIKPTSTKISKSNPKNKAYFSKLIVKYIKILLFSHNKDQQELAEEKLKSLINYLEGECNSIHNDIDDLKDDKSREILSIKISKLENKINSDKRKCNQLENLLNTEKYKNRFNELLLIYEKEYLRNKKRLCGDLTGYDLQICQLKHEIKLNNQLINLCSSSLKEYDLNNASNALFRDNSISDDDSFRLLILDKRRKSQDLSNELKKKLKKVTFEQILNDVRQNYFSELGKIEQLHHIQIQELNQRIIDLESDDNVFHDDINIEKNEKMVIINQSFDNELVLLNEKSKNILEKEYRNLFPQDPYSEELNNFLQQIQMRKNNGLPKI